MPSARAGDRADTRFGGVARQVAVPGGVLEVETLGAGPPILLIHGWTLDRRIWTPQVAALSSAFQVIAYDRRGCGRSTAPSDPQQEVDDVVLLLDALGLSTATIVGMSQGARVALQVAIRHPARVTALVLHGAPLPFAAAGTDTDENVPIEAMRAAALAGDRGALRDIWREHPLMRLFGADHAELLDRIATDYDGRDLLARVAPIVVRPEDIRGVALRSLIIVGQHDSAERKRAAAELGRLLGCDPVETAGGHLCNLCHAAAYTRLLSDFVGSDRPNFLPHLLESDTGNYHGR